MIDQGSCVEVMYPDLYRGLNLKPEDLTTYDSPLKVKYPLGDRIEELAGNQSMARQCLLSAILHQPAAKSLARLRKEKEELVIFLKRNVDVFAWNAYKVPGMDLSFICHHLNVSPSFTPRKQPPRHSSKEHSDAIKDEVMKLKQAGAIKERMITRMFELQLGKNIEIYIDDMMVKSKVESEHVNDLRNIFDILRKHKLQLNASKYSFGIGSEKFLGYMVTHREIEVNPDQIKWKGFEWTEECVLALQQLKEYLSRPPIMSRLKVDKVLFAYIMVASLIVSLVLVRVDSGVQRPVYYVSKSLHEAKLPLRFLLRSVDYIVRITKWGTILEAFDIKYMPRTSVKGQVLADLVTEFAETPLVDRLEEQNMDGKSVGIISLQEPLSRKVYINSAANHRGSGVELVLVSPKKITIEKSLKLGSSATNNEAEYEALLVGMTMVQKMGGKAMEIFSDSRLVVGQVQGELEARDPRMQEYLNQVRHLQPKFESFILSQVPRSRNTHADSLATLATSSAHSLPRVILVEDLCKPSEAKRNVVHVHQIRVGPSWIDLIVLFLKNDVLPESKFEADKIQSEAPQFWLSENQKLYKRSFFGPYLLCVHPEVIELLLEELHEGICGSHTGGRSLSHRALTQGYWWPNMQKGAQEYVKKCDQY
ncbi:uncharacterized protein LOC126704077 [Quercus robur]|uniref:uncharacterized protein LOC126704077 n=1 Tax=Quercus robur TaxID=38942 RepID=UPI002162C782|nr:uncharacterized protein LOC126704077 [Quercus robur]